MRCSLTLCLLAVSLAACAPVGVLVTPSPIEVEPSRTFTPIPTLTRTLSPTSTLPASLGTIALDFLALLCNAEWMNGGQHLAPCPNPNTDRSGGYAAVLDPLTEGLPVNTPVLVMIPSASALFLRYPSFTVAANDRLRTTLRCRTSSPYDVQFALEYYDAKDKYHGDFMAWNYKTGDAPIEVDADLSPLAGQSVDFVLALRLFHAIDSPQQDNGLWIAPHIYRPLP